MLITAFRATFEEVLEADVILHVRDIAHEDAEAQRKTSKSSLPSLASNPAMTAGSWKSGTRSDLLDEARIAAARAEIAPPSRQNKPVIVSALTGQGLDDLRTAIEARLANGRIIFDVTLDPANGAGLNWLHENAEVMCTNTEADGIVHLRVRIATGTGRATSPQV